MAEISYDEATKTYWDRINRYLKDHGVRMYCLDDVTLEVFLLLYLKWDEIDHSEERVSKWIYNTANYKVLEYSRNIKKVPFTYSLEEHLTADTYETSIESLLDPDDYKQSERCAQYIERLKECVPPKEREIVDLKYIKGYTVEQIAAELNISLRCAHMRLWRLEKYAQKHKQQIING